MEADLSRAAEQPKNDEMEFESTEVVHLVDLVQVQTVTDNGSLAERRDKFQAAQDEEILPGVPVDNEANSEFVESADLESEDDVAGESREQVEHDEFMTTCKKQYYTHDKEMQRCLEEILELARVSKADRKPVNFAKILTAVKHCQVHRRAATIKYLNATEGRRKGGKAVVHGKHPETVEKINARLRGPEELLNGWAPSPDSAAKLPEGGLLMRVTDEASRAKIYPEIGFLSGGSTADLTSLTGRRKALALHLDWRNRKPTVFVSTTGSAIDFAEWRIPHMVKRDKKKPSRCTVKLTFINGNARLAAGWPILRATEEIARYKVPVPSGRDAPWFADEYLLPFRASTEQIIATHCWTAVETYMAANNCDYAQWHHNVVLPAFAEHEEARLQGRPARGKIGCVCCGH